MNPLLPLCVLAGTVCGGLAVWALVSGEARVLTSYTATRADDPGFYWMAVAARVGGCIASFVKAFTLAFLAMPLAPA